MFRTWLIACLLAGFSFAQTRTSATQEGNNTFTGTNTFTSLNGECIPSAFTGAAIQACIDSLTSGGIVRLRQGTYTVTSTINVNKNHLGLVGAGWGSLYAGNVGATTLNVSAGVTGIDITGNWCSLERFFLYSASTGSGTDDGIRFRGPAPRAENIAVKNFGRYGFSLDSSGGRNVDFWRFEQLAAYGNRSDGFHWEGGVDMGVGYGHVLNADSNGGWGFNVGGATGGGAGNNHFDTLHVNGNTLGGFYVNASNNFFFDLYAESGTGSSFVINSGISNTRVWFVATGQPTTIINSPTTSLANQIFYNAPEGVLAQTDTFIAPNPGATSPTTYRIASGFIANGAFSMKDETNNVNILRYDPGTGWRSMENWLFTSGKAIRCNAAGGCDLGISGIGWGNIYFGTDANTAKITGTFAATRNLTVADPGANANIDLRISNTATVDLASVASGACSTDSSDVTVTGASVGDPVNVTAATALQAGTWLIGRVTASNTARFQFCNLSGSGVDRASDTYTIRVTK